MSAYELEQERSRAKQQAILECEEERSRRLQNDEEDSAWQTESVTVAIPSQTEMITPLVLSREVSSESFAETSSKLILRVTTEDENDRNFLPTTTTTTTATSNIHSSTATAGRASTPSLPNRKREKTQLHGLLQAQMQAVLGLVHDEISERWQAHQQASRSAENQQKQLAVEMVLSQIRQCVSLLWPFSRVEVFGSTATGE